MSVAFDRGWDGVKLLGQGVGGASLTYSGQRPQDFIPTRMKSKPQMCVFLGEAAISQLIFMREVFCNHADVMCMRGVS